MVPLTLPSPTESLRARQAIPHLISCSHHFYRLSTFWKTRQCW